MPISWPTAFKQVGLSGIKAYTEVSFLEIFAFLFISVLMMFAFNFTFAKDEKNAGTESAKAFQRQASEEKEAINSLPQGHL